MKSDEAYRNSMLVSVCLLMEDIDMIENIFVGIMFVVAVAAGIWGWWIENGHASTEDKKDDKDRGDYND